MHPESIAPSSERRRQKPQIHNEKYESSARPPKRCKTAETTPHSIRFPAFGSSRVCKQIIPERNPAFQEHAADGEIMKFTRIPPWGVGSLISFAETKRTSRN